MGGGGRKLCRVVVGMLMTGCGSCVGSAEAYRRIEG